ncbi:hypothetical protein AVEN_212924-1, partial [Araneus ventricosus]
DQKAINGRTARVRLGFCSLWCSVKIKRKQAQVFHCNLRITNEIRDSTPDSIPSTLAQAEADLVFLVTRRAKQACITPPRPAHETYSKDSIPPTICHLQCRSQILASCK